MPQDNNDTSETSQQKFSSARRYGCASYREEMQLLGLHRRLEDASLSSEEKKMIQVQIAELEKKLGL